MIGIIGGSGLEKSHILEKGKEKAVKTPFGKPSEKFLTGKINGIDVAILARHGKKHSIPPSRINFRANIWAFRQLGAKHIIASTACGSLRLEIEPGQIVFPNQFIDRTTQRKTTFYDKNVVCHIPMAEPFCKDLRKKLIETSKELNLKFHESGTVVTIEGPRFSTKAESNMFREWQADIINMTTVPEVVLAKEAGICYQSIAMATDYDCWLEDRPPVTIEEILTVMKKNAENVQKLIVKTIPKIIEEKECECREAVKHAIVKH